MIRKPKFRDDLRARVIAPDLLVLAGESDYSAFRGNLFPSLAALIDGTKTVPEIIDELEAKAPLPDVHYGLTLLAEDGVIVEGEDGMPTGQAAFGQLLGVDPEKHLERLRSVRVWVRSLGGAPARPLETLLQEMDVPLARQEEARHARQMTDSPAAEDEFEIVLVDDYLDDGLAELNREALARSRPWMLVKPTGPSVWVGPIFSPGKTACWACLAHRLRENRPVHDYLAIHGADESNGDPLQANLPPQRTVASLGHAALGLAATDVLRWILEPENHPLEGGLVTIDGRSLETERHTVLRLDGCPECGDPSEATVLPYPLELQSRPKLFLNDGGYRTLLPETTLERYGHHISRITGIVDGIRRVREDPFLQVYMSGYTFPPKLKERSFLESGLRAKSTGKGMYPAQARASALCEALERYSGVFRGNEPRRKARFTDLEGEAVHPNDCMQFSPAQYAARDEWNARHRAYNWVPEPFDETREIEWTRVWSLSEDRIRYVPTCYCYYGYPYREGHDLCRADSNGNAAGNTLEEAILQGFMEVVERDCVAMWWYNRASRPAVDLESFAQPYFADLRAHYRASGRSLRVLDITGDLGIPAFAAVSITLDSEVRLEDLVVGFGAHFDPAIAVSRALTEMNQFLPSALAGRTLRVAGGELEDGEFLEPDETVGVSRSVDYATLQSEDLRDDVLACVRLAEERGLEVLVLEQTRSDVGLPVVKVIVPGMYPFWARFAPGRLYTVPVELGWMAEKTREEDLNPAHIKI